MRKATINPKNTDNKYFQYAARVSNINPFINKYNWKGINYPSKIDDWKTFEKHNPTITLNILYIKEKEKFPVYVSKINSNCEKKYINDSK